MSTPHNSANPGDIAKLVLMPGDPLRAKVVAETYLENPVQINTVRGMLGYTGTYKGHRVTVMGSGMGMPSIGIYSYELFKFYDVDAIIRIGSTGGMLPEIKVYDVILASAAYSASSYAYEQSGCEDHTILPSAQLNERLRKAAKELGYPIVEGVIHSSDIFYYEDNVAAERLKRNVEEHHTIAAEMESFALFHNANVCGKEAACLLTVSDNMVTHQETTAEERQNSFTRMMEIALEAAQYYD